MRGGEVSERRWGWLPYWGFCSKNVRTSFKKHRQTTPTGASSGRPVFRNMFFVYFLRLKNGNIYVGSTINISKRMEEHQLGLVSSTKHLLPFKLISYIVVGTEKKSRDLEKYFKTGSGKAILKKRILADEEINQHFPLKF